MKTVFVVGGDASVRSMFHTAGWANVFDPVSAEYICFTGGADVSPSLYGEANTGLSSCNLKRDEAEYDVYMQFRGKKMLGICRGGQFLNVMSGGKLIQDITLHSGLREVTTTSGNMTLHDDHHQGIVPGVGAEIIAVDTVDRNVEIVWYSGTQALCFQAHPEWGHNGTKDYFFRLIKEKFS